MSSKKFNCKAEEVTAIAGFVTESLQSDLSDFQNYSPGYTQAKIDAITAKRNVCLELEKSNTVIQQLKSVTATLVEKENGLRPKLNKLEGYVNRSAAGLNLAAGGFGISEVRKDISRGNDEGIIAGMKTVLGNIAHNSAALQAQGLKQDFIDELTASVTEIDELNIRQNTLQNQRNSTTAANLNDYNELWDMIASVCSDARAIYKGVDEVKLQKYTIATLISRVNAEGSNKKTDTGGTGGDTPAATTK